MKINYVSFEEIRKEIIKISNKIKSKKYNIKEIIPIANGGLVPASILSKQLNINVTDILLLKTYITKNNIKKIKMIKNIKLDIYNNKDIVIIDDILDSAETIINVLDNINININNSNSKLKLVLLFPFVKYEGYEKLKKYIINNNNNNNIEIDISNLEINTDKYLDFCWEY